MVAHATIRERARTRTSLAAYERHARKHGTEMVMETALGLGEVRSDLTTTQAIVLARALVEIDPTYRLGADPHLALQDADVRRTFEDRLAPVAEALSAPRVTGASRSCEVCGRAIHGRRDRRTCSPKCRKALEREGGIGAFSRPYVTPTTRSDGRVRPDATVTATAREHGRYRPQEQTEPTGATNR